MMNNLYKRIPGSGSILGARVFDYGSLLDDPRCIWGLIWGLHGLVGFETLQTPMEDLCGSFQKSEGPNTDRNTAGLLLQGRP